MSIGKSPIKSSAADKAAFAKESKKPEKPRPVVTDADRDDESLPKPLVKIMNYAAGAENQASLEELNEQMREFHKVILLIEDQSPASDACAKALHALGYDGVQLITRVPEAEQHLDDIVSNLTVAPAAIILDLGLGNESGFSVLRKCHAEPRLKKVPILVWTKHTDSREKAFSEYLGADDFLVKSGDEEELRQTLKKLLAPKAEAA